MASRDFEVAFRLGAQLTSEFKNTFSSANNAFKSLAGAAAAIGGMVGIGSVVAQVSEMTDSMNKLTAATGVSGQEMKELQGVAKNVFRDNYGESFTDVTDALAKVKQNIQGLNSGELEQITKDALMLADTFDGDVNEVTRATNNMMKNFGIESTQAMDLFAAGAQRGLNFSGEMFDNVAEYAPLFATMGYSAEEYFGILQRGAQAGVYNLDYVNDVMKEFQIRTKDGSKATGEAMGMLSKDTQNVWKEFLKGNGTVSDVASKVVGELQGMDDQVAASQIAVSLFGTKFEDLESDAVYAMLGTNEAMKDVEGAMAKINEIRFDSVGKAVQGIGRILMMDLVMPIADMALPPLNLLANYLSDNLPGAIETTKNVLTTMAPIFAGLAAAVVTYRTALFLTTAYQTAFNAVQKITPKLLYAHRTALLAYTFAGGGARGMIAAMRSGMAALNLTMLANPFVLVTAAIIGVGVALYTAYKMSDRFRDAVNSAFATMKTFVVDAANSVTASASSIWNGLIDSAKGIGSKITDLLGADMVGSIKNVVGNFVESFKTGLSSLPGIISLIAPTIATMGLAFLGVSGPIGLLIGGVVSVIGFLYRLSQTNESVASGLGAAWTSIKTAFAPVLEVLQQGIADFATGVGPQLTETIAVISASIAELGPSFAQVGATLVELGTLIFTQWATTVSTLATTVLPLLLQVFQTVFPLIVSVVMTVVPIIIQVITSIIPIILQLVQLVIPLILSVVQMVFPMILTIIQSVLPIVATLITVVVNVILTLAQTVLPLVLSVIQMVFPIILSIIQTIIPIVVMVLQSLVTIINTVIIPAINSILAIVQFVFPYIQLIIQNALAVVNGIITAAMALLQGDWSGAWEAIKGTAETIMNNIISFFQGINLFEVGKSIITGLIDGVKSMGSAVIGAISGMIPEPIRGAASKLLGALPGFAEGGVVAAPTLAWVGEGGDTESIIPWNNSQRSKDLWMQTGHALGMLGQNGMFGGIEQQQVMNQASAISGAIPEFAIGGVVSAPTLAWVGEGGDTESIIPWNNSQRSKDLWMQTGHAIGALDELNTAGQGAPDWSVPSGNDTFNNLTTNQGSSIIHLNNYTTINANGGDVKAIEEGVNRGNESALETLRRWQHDERRVSFD